MSEEFVPPTNHDELMQRIEADWQGLQAAFAKIPPELDATPDDGGWSAKDQIAHVAAWERSTTAILRGESRSDVLGVPESMIQTGDIDALNKVIHDRIRGLSREEAEAEARSAHEAFVGALKRFSWEDLHRPRSSFQPNLPDPPENAEMINWVYGDSLEHYPEHTEALERIAAGQS